MTTLVAPEARPPVFPEVDLESNLCSDRNLARFDCVELDVLRRTLYLVNRTRCVTMKLVSSYGTVVFQVSWGRQGEEETPMTLTCGQTRATVGLDDTLQPFIADPALMRRFNADLAAAWFIRRDNRLRLIDRPHGKTCDVLLTDDIRRKVDRLIALA